MRIFYVHRECFISWRYWAFAFGRDNGGRVGFNVCGLTFEGPRLFKPIPMEQR